jgi:cell wall-associated NlpC family hydrolase
MTHWAETYLGIPYRVGGQDRSGTDCWGFFRLVMREQFGRDIPVVGVSANDLRALLAEFKGHPMREAWREIIPGLAGEGDGYLFAHRPGWPDHVGIVLTEGRVLHCVRGIGALIEPADRALARGWREMTAWRPL